VLLVAMLAIMNIQINVLALEDNTYNHERLILDGLGIISEEIEYDGDEILTRGDFSVMLANLIGYDGKAVAEGIFYDVEKEYYAADEIEFLYTQGIIKGYDDGTFRSGANITYQEVISLLLRIMGIDKYAEHYKNSYFPEKNIKNDLEFVTFNMAIGYIYEAINTQVYEYTSGNGSMQYSQSDETVLEKWRDISVVKGVVLTIGYKSVLYNGAKGIFLVDNLSLHTEEPYKFDCVGKYSEVYYYNDESPLADEVVLAQAIEKQNDITVIDGDDAYYKDGKIYYLENAKEKSISISQRAYLARNYKPAYNTDIESLFEINSGRIIVNKIPKNDMEIVMIEDYENYVASGKSEYEQKIYTLDGKTLPLEEVEELIIKDSTGNKLELSDINNEDIVTVLRGDNYETNVEIIVSADIATGNIDSISKDVTAYELKIDNVCYKTVKNFNANLLPNVGEEVSLYLNIFGDVVYIQNRVSSNYKYGYLCKVFSDEVEEDVLHFRIFGDDNQMHKLEAHKRIRIDNKVYKNYAEAINALKNGTRTDSIYQPIRFKKNDEGFLIDIDTEYLNVAANESIYSLTPVFKCYDKNRILDESINGSRKGELAYSNGSFEGYFIPESNSKNFRVPTEYTNDERFYTATIQFKTESIGIDAYTSNPDRLTADFTIQYSGLGVVAEDTKIGVIMDSCVALTEDDEVGLKLTIASRENQGGKSYFVHELCPLTDVPTRGGYHTFAEYTPKIGDAVIYSLNSRNEIVEISPYYVSEDKKWYVQNFVTDTYEGTWSGTALNFAKNERFNMGCVYDQYMNTISIALTDNKNVDNTTEKRSFVLDSSVKIYLVEGRHLREITIDELKTYKRDGSGCNEIVVETYINKPFLAIVYE